MIYTKMTLKAMNIAFSAHQGQTDKAGFPYIHHPLYVANMMKTEKRCTAALLHDVVEDSDVTLDDLINEGFPEDVIEAIDFLTRRDGENYMEYIKRLKDNSIARSVKMADLYHNSDRSRVFEEPTKEDINRWKRYDKALEILKQAQEQSRKKKK